MELDRFYYSLIEGVDLGNQPEQSAAYASHQYRPQPSPQGGGLGRDGSDARSRTVEDANMFLSGGEAAECTIGG